MTASEKTFISRPEATSPLRSIGTYFWMPLPVRDLDDAQFLDVAGNRRLSDIQSGLVQTGDQFVLRADFLFTDQLEKSWPVVHFWMFSSW